MELYVNTEQIEAITEELFSLQNCLTTEYARMKKVAYNLQGQSVSIDSIYSATQNIHNIENEIHLLVQKLRKIKQIYDTTEYEVQNAVQQLPVPSIFQSGAPQVTIYKSAAPLISQNTSSRYISFVSVVPILNDMLTMHQLLWNQNTKEFSKVMNRILALSAEQSEEWLIEKLREWMREHIDLSTGYIPAPIVKPFAQLDATDLFQDT